MTEHRTKEPLACPECGSTNLGGPPIPGGADKVCNECGAQFDVFAHGPDCIIPGNRHRTSNPSNDPTDWIGYLEAYPKVEPYLAIAAAWRKDKAEIERLTAEVERLSHYADTCGGSDNDGRCPMRPSDETPAAPSCSHRDGPWQGPCEACQQAGPYCPDTLSPCLRMCQTMCHIRTERAASKTRRKS